MEEIAFESKESYAPHFALVMVQVFFGSAAILGKLALVAFPPFAIVGFRVSGAALSFGLLQKFGGKFRLDKRVHYLYFALFACFGVIFNQLLFFKGLSLTTATNTSLLAVMIPVFAILVSVVIGNDKLTLLKIAGTITAGGGVIAPGYGAGMGDTRYDPETNADRGARGLAEAWHAGDKAGFAGEHAVRAAYNYSFNPGGGWAYQGDSVVRHYNQLLAEQGMQPLA